MIRWKCGGNLSNYPYLHGIESLYHTSCDAGTRFVWCPLYGVLVCRLDAPEREDFCQAIFETPTHDHGGSWEDRRREEQNHRHSEVQGAFHQKNRTCTRTSNPYLQRKNYSAGSPILQRREILDKTHFQRKAVRTWTQMVQPSSTIPVHDYCEFHHPKDPCRDGVC